MPLFRFHRGGLHESLRTTVVVKNGIELCKIITNSFDYKMRHKNKRSVRLKITPYPDDNNFDERIGWYTHMVSVHFLEDDTMEFIGFLSEPLECLIDYIEEDNNEQVA